MNDPSQQRSKETLSGECRGESPSENNEKKGESTETYDKLLTKEELDDYLPSLETKYMHLGTHATYTKDKEPSDDDDPRENQGAWMMFHPIDMVDDMWKKLYDLYYNDELPDVTYIKTSTARYNPRASRTGISVLMAFCRPWQDEKLIKRVGYNLALKMAHFSSHNYMFFKPNFMIGQGTRATGRKINSYYRIPVPQTIEEAHSRKLEISDLFNDEKKYNDWLNRQEMYKRKIVNLEKGIAFWVPCE